MSTIEGFTRCCRLGARAVCSSALLGLAACGPGPVSSPQFATNAPVTLPAKAEAPAGALEYGRLVGRWQRADAEYVLEIRACDQGTGKLDLGYFNPSPIHVSRADASIEAGKVKVFVELQDTGYPGCTYRLTYFAQTDQLFGVYYQAALDQSFDVEFQRQP